MSVALFEPGSVSLAEQIRIFSQCKGVAGIYGAEFANVIWMPPHTPVIWIDTQEGRWSVSVIGIQGAPWAHSLQSLMCYFETLTLANRSKWRRVGLVLCAETREPARRHGLRHRVA